MNESQDTIPDPLVEVVEADVECIQAIERLHQAVRQARADDCTWAEIGAVLGVSRQAAYNRFGVKRHISETSAAYLREQLDEPPANIY